MPGPLREPVITLSGGLWDRQVFYVSDWDERRRAAERMGRTADDFCGWPRAYRQDTASSHRWIWTAGADWPTKRSAGQAT